MRTLRTSVRRLVEFLLRTGDIDAEGRGRDVEALQAGSDIHRMLQAAGGAAYQAEVPLAGTFYFPEASFNPHAARLDIREEAVSGDDGFFLRVEGRADGIIDDGTHPLVIDEIKGMKRDVANISEPATLHEAQALCYAYLYLRSRRGASALSSAYGEAVIIRLTYASMTTGEVRQIERPYAVPDIEAWFFRLLERAQRWAAWRVRHDALRDRSLASLALPLKPRAGQQQAIDAVSATIGAGRRLYLQAPTGSGKTIATLYPALKALGAGKAARIAYLTAKTPTRQAALACLDLLRQQDFAANALVMTARAKICPLRARRQGTDVRTRPLASLCNPVECPLARSHYDAVNDALFEAITCYDVLDVGRIKAVAARHHVCPYELQRDAARWADVVFGDYHYAFAPSASLLGLADEPGNAGAIYLVDEAHNLVERMREMYSAELAVTELKELERLLRGNTALSSLAQATHVVVAAFPRWDKTVLPNGQPGAKGRRSRPTYQVVSPSDGFESSLSALTEGMGDALERLFPTVGGTDGDGPMGKPGTKAIELYLTLRDMSLKTGAFLGALQRAEAGYVTYLGRTETGGRMLRVACVDPSHDLAERLEQATATVLFSGTLLPLDYHCKLLAAREGDTSLYVTSDFDHRRQQVLVASDVSARFSRRGTALYARIASYLVALTQARPGNYLAFLPSYGMLEEVAAALDPLVGTRTCVVRQHPGMREDERERFVARFREPRAAGASLVGLCVLGGIFGESIDLPGEALVGVVVVGTGMPQSTAAREVIRDYFDAKLGKGFAYAYTYPGLNKVLQAAGRLIRSEKDHGVVLLLDDRFLENELRESFPREWSDVRSCTLETLPALLARGGSS